MTKHRSCVERSVLLTIGRRYSDVFIGSCSNERFDYFQLSILRRNEQRCGATIVLWLVYGCLAVQQRLDNL